MHAPTLKTGPASPVVSWADVDAHLRLDGDTTEQDLVESYIDAAIAHLDGWAGILGRALVTQTWQQDFDEFERKLRLPLAPIQSVESVKWRDEDGQMSTVSSDDYRLLTDERGSYVRFNDDYDFPSDLNEVAAVSVEFTAGYGDPADVPRAINQAILLMVGHWYEHREAIAMGTSPAVMPLAVDRLLAPYRRVSP